MLPSQCNPKTEFFGKTAAVWSKFGLVAELRTFTVCLHIGHTQLLPENKYLIIGSKCFHKRFLLLRVGKISTENTSV
jgi:hypothetical protein